MMTECHAYNEHDEKLALARAISILRAEAAPSVKLLMVQYLATSALLIIGVVASITLPLPKNATTTLWPVLAAVLAAKIWVGLRAARFAAAIGIAAIFAFGVDTFTDGMLDGDDVVQALWCVGWSVVVWGIAALARTQTVIRFDRFIKDR